MKTKFKSKLFGVLLVLVMVLALVPFASLTAFAEVEKKFTLMPTGGTVNAGESLNVAWQTSFIPTSTEIQYWDGEAWDQWDIQYPQNALDDYDFESHEAASYRFRIVTYIGNDAVATSNEFVVIWEEAKIELGDITGDGTINMEDAAALQRHVLKIEIIEDADVLAVADVNGDAIVNMEDAANIMRYALKIIDSFE